MGVGGGALRGLTQTLRAHGGQVDRGGHGAQSLVGADVGGGLLPADVLLSGLESQDVAAVSVVVRGLADDTAGEFTHVFALAGKESDIRTAIAERNTQGLAVSDGNVCAPFCRSLEHCQSRRIAILYEQCTGSMNRIGDSAKVLDHAVTADRRDNHARNIRTEFLEHIPCIDNLDVGILKISFDNIQHILHQFGGNHYLVALAGACYGHSESLCCCGRPVVHGSVGNIHAGKAANHALPLKDIAKRTLRNLALVRSISCQEFGTGGDIRDHRGNVMIISSLPHEHLEAGVLLSEFIKEITNFLLAESIWKFVFLIIDEICRHIGVQVVQAPDAYPLQHFTDVISGMGEICGSGHLTGRFRHMQRH